MLSILPLVLKHDVSKERLDISSVAMPVHTLIKYIHTRVYVTGTSKELPKLFARRTTRLHLISTNKYSGHHTPGMSIQLFEEKDHAETYAKYRPTYPDCLYKTIIDYCDNGVNKTSNRELAVDVGCGNGQSTRPLCAYFRRVIGSDASAQQITAAPKDVENLNFRVGKAEDLSYLENDSVDLLTVAQAVHWFDSAVFYKEVRRVVKPGGVFVAYGYGNNVLDNLDAHRHMVQFYSGLLGAYWDKARRHVDQQYSGIDHPFSGWTRIDDPSLAITRRMPVDAYIGYLSSWSAWRTYLKHHPESPALDELRQRLVAIYENNVVDGLPSVGVTWPTFLLIGRKPVN